MPYILLRRKVAECSGNAVRRGEFFTAYPEKGGPSICIALGREQRRFVSLRDADRPAGELPFDMAEDVARGRKRHNAADAEAFSCELFAHRALCQLPVDIRLFPKACEESL